MAEQWLHHFGTSFILKESFRYCLHLGLALGDDIESTEYLKNSPCPRDGGLCRKNENPASQCPKSKTSCNHMPYIGGWKQRPQNAKLKPRLTLACETDMSAYRKIDLYTIYLRPKLLASTVAG